MTVDKYALMRVRLHKNYVWRHGRITNGHFEWLLVRGGIDDIMCCLHSEGSSGGETMTTKTVLTDEEGYRQARNRQRCAPYVKDAFEKGEKAGREELLKKRLVCAKPNHGNPLEYCSFCVGDMDALKERIKVLEADKEIQATELRGKINEISVLSAKIRKLEAALDKIANASAISKDNNQDYWEAKKIAKEALGNCGSASGIGNAVGLLPQSEARTVGIARQPHSKKKVK